MMMCRQISSNNHVTQILSQVMMRNLIKVMQMMIKRKMITVMMLKMQMMIWLRLKQGLFRHLTI